MLERDDQLAVLERVHRLVVRGDSGACVLVSGEAGIGKTTLVQAFLARLPKSTRVLRTGCESLFTPRPFGPLADLADTLPPSASHALSAGNACSTLFPLLLRHFRDALQPGVFVVEDVHWADAGTLDLLRYLGRRLRELRLLLLLTHRDVSLDATHPLCLTLADLPAAHTQRIALAPLSRDAVAAMARAAARDPASLYATTAGNPFYVQEVLAHDDGALPPSVRDSVQATVWRMSPAGRALAEWISLFPGRAERRWLDPVAQPTTQAVDECLRSGLVDAAADALAFRHDIAREAVYAALPAHRRQQAHRAVYEVLRRGASAPVDAARLIHHAQAGALPAEIGLQAPLAAQQAGASGAHREAARLYAIALQHGAALPRAEGADLLERHALELMLTNQHHAAITQREAACALRLAEGDRLRAAVNLRWLARLHWFDRGSDPQTLAMAHRAIEMLEQLPPHRERALAYSTLSHLLLVGDDMQGAQAWGLKAIETAESFNDAEALSHALNNVGAARLRTRDDALAWDRLQRSLALAIEHDLEQDAARAYNNLFILSVLHHDFAHGLRHADEGIAYCEAKGLDIFTVRIRIRRAFAHIVRGRWDLADLDLAEVAERHTPSPMEAATAAFVQQILTMRRTAQADAVTGMTRAVQALEQVRVDIWFISTAACLAEAAWLEGRPQDFEVLVRPALARYRALPDPWRCGELAAWLLRGGHPVDIDVSRLPRPYALELRGDWRGAAAEWARLGCPYNQALALTAGDEQALREALGLVDALGAAATAERLRQLLRDRGARGVPRGPQPRTRDDPLGLTTRERVVFDLLRQGLAAADIAARLSRSQRTVEHHLAALYRKLEVNSRFELLARFPLESGSPSAAEIGSRPLQSG